MASLQKASFSGGCGSFVVKKTFIEFDDRSQSSDSAADEPCVGLRRSASDSQLYECPPVNESFKIDFEDNSQSFIHSLTESTFASEEDFSDVGTQEDASEDSSEAAKEDSSEVNSMLSPSNVGQDDLATENARLVEENEKLKKQCMEAAKAAAVTSAGHSTQAKSKSKVKAVPTQHARPVLEHEEGLWNMDGGAQHGSMSKYGMNPYGNGGALFPSGVPLANMNEQGMFVFDFATGMRMQCVPMCLPMQMPVTPGQHQANSKKHKEPFASKNQSRRREDGQQQRKQQSQQWSPAAPPGNFDHQATRGTHQASTQPEVPIHDCTTVMLRNLPNNYSRSMLLDLMDQEGFAKLYDFIYLPIDFKTKASLGYAFVNLTDHESANRFRLRLDGFSEWILPTRKVCGVSWSGPHQGLEAHIERYRNSPVMHAAVPDMYKPVIFKDGIVVAFPPPTKTLRAPRIRHFHGPGCVFSPLDAASQAS